MFITVVLVGIRENKRLNDCSLVLEEKNTEEKILVNVASDLVPQIKFILGENDYIGVYDIFFTIIERFGFSLKKTVLDFKVKKSSLYFYDEFGNNFSANTSLIDGIVLSTYNASPIYIDESVLKKYRNLNKSISYSSLSLSKYSVEDLYNMLENAKYDDNFLEEAVKIREEIKLRENRSTKIYKNGIDIVC